MSVRALYIVFVFCCLIQICGSPRALAGDDGGPDFYVDGGVSRYILALPDYRPIQAFNYPGGPPCTLVTRLAVNDDPATGIMGRLTLGIRTASPIFFELTGRTFKTNDRINTAYTTAEEGSDYIGFFPVDGLRSANGTSGTAFVCLHTRFSESGGRFLVGYALKLGYGLTLSPFLGGEIMDIDQSYDMDYYTTTDADIREFHDRVDTRYRGGLIGARLQIPLGECLATIAGSVGRYEVRTDYKGI